MSNPTKHGDDTPRAAVEQGRAASVQVATPPNAEPADSKSVPAEPAIHFEDLVQRCMGNIDLALSLLEQSHAQLESDIADLQQCALADEQTEVARLAHRLKGASASLGAYALSDVCARIEQQCGAPDGPPATIHWQELETQWAQFIESASGICRQE